MNLGVWEYVSPDERDSQLHLPVPSDIVPGAGEISQPDEGQKELHERRYLYNDADEFRKRTSRINSVFRLARTLGEQYRYPVIGVRDWRELSKALRDMVASDPRLRQIELRDQWHAHARSPVSSSNIDYWLHTREILYVEAKAYGVPDMLHKCLPILHFLTTVGRAL